jgi:hypothetical protein
MDKIKFILNGCDISFYAIAPKDITLEQLLKQCDKIKPDWCACGIKSDDFNDDDVEIIIDYNSVKKAYEDVACRIIEDKGE